MPLEIEQPKKGALIIMWLLGYQGLVALGMLPLILAFLDRDSRIVSPMKDC